MTAITAAKKISFHAVGDTGAAKVNSFQTARQAIENEASVADAMASDVQEGGPTGPAFFFHLGDVVYNFGEGQYYYDQFYEPFRAYDRPIFAIPGNHDGMVFGDEPDLPRIPTLTAFLRNFCAETPGPSPDAGGDRALDDEPARRLLHPRRTLRLDRRPLHQRPREPRRHLESRTATTRRSPATSSSTSSAPSSQRLAPARKAGERAVIVACHHPPASVDSQHGGSNGLAERHRHRVPGRRLLARRRPVRPRPPLPALHAKSRRARDPLRRRRLGRLRRDAARSEGSPKPPSPSANTRSTSPRSSSSATSP